MTLHTILWDAIDKFANKHNMSCSALAKASGLDATAFNKSKRWTCYGKPRWPSTQSIAKILTSTGSSPQDFIDCLPHIPKDIAPSKLDRPTPDAQNNITPRKGRRTGPAK